MPCSLRRSKLNRHGLSKKTSSKTFCKSWTQNKYFETKKSKLPQCPSCHELTIRIIETADSDTCWKLFGASGRQSRKSWVQNPAFVKDCSQIRGCLQRFWNDGWQNSSKMVLAAFANKMLPSSRRKAEGSEFESLCQRNIFLYKYLFNLLIWSSCRELCTLYKYDSVIY